jgi:hypothetical protein
MVTLVQVKNGQVLAKPTANRVQLKQAVRQSEDKDQEVETLLRVVDLCAYELNWSMTVALYLSELLLLQADPGGPLAANLSTMVKKMMHSHEIVKGLDRLTRY